jgi:hypothetical protein
MKMSKTLRALIPFNENDWMAFSGCESNNPLIGGIHLEGCKSEATIIVDDISVTIINNDLDDDIPSDEDAIVFEFANHAQAVKFAVTVPCDFDFDLLKSLKTFNDY